MDEKQECKIKCCLDSLNSTVDDGDNNRCEETRINVDSINKSGGETFSYKLYLSSFILLLSLYFITSPTPKTATASLLDRNIIDNQDMNKVVSDLRLTAPQQSLTEYHTAAAKYTDKTTCRLKKRNVSDKSLPKIERNAANTTTTSKSPRPLPVQDSYSDIDSNSKGVEKRNTHQTQRVSSERAMDIIKKSVKKAAKKAAKKVKKKVKKKIKKLVHKTKDKIHHAIHHASHG